MDNDDDTNPFAEPSMRQTTGKPFTNIQTANEYNPFTNDTAVTQPASLPSYPSTAAYFSPSPPAPPTPVYQPPTYSAYPPPPAAATIPSTPVYASSEPKPTATRVDVPVVEKQQSQLEEREKQLAEREKALQKAAAIGSRVKNFPPCPSKFACGSCFYQNISAEIPPEFQRWVRFAYYLWIIYSVALVLNMITALSYFIVESSAVMFGVALVYLFLFVPMSYVCWFRPLYRAFRTDSSVYFMLFFFIGIMHIAADILFAIGLIDGMCGFIVMITLFNAGGNRVAVGLLALIVTLSFALIATADCLLLIKVHRLYRQTGASIEQAQRELQTAFVNSPTVRGAARDAAAVGINEVLRTDNAQQRA